MKNVIPETFLGVGYTRDQAGLPLEAVRVPVPQPAAEEATERSGGEGGYAVARQFLTVLKPPSLSFRDAAALPMCFLSAFAALYGAVKAGDTVYIPGGGGGVGHLAVQMAARVLGARLVISSGSTPASIALARRSGAHHVFDYKRDDIGAEIVKLTGGRGVDVVFDATYSEAGFVETAQTVRQSGSWVVLGVGPGKTTRLVETDSPVNSILAERGAKHVNINLLRYFSEPATLDGEAKTFLERGGSVRGVATRNGP